MSVRAVTPYVERHGLVYTDHAYDAATDELATEHPEDRERGLDESPSHYLVRTSKRRGALDPAATRPASPPPAGRPDHDATGGGILSPPPVARGPLDEQAATQ